MKKTFIILTFYFVSGTIGKSQSFDPPAGFDTSTAIHKDSIIFIDWANEIEIFRGYNDIAFPENKHVDYGINTNAIGKADGNPNVVSLGDGGSAVLRFNYPIVNGEGFDFAIFENGFFENNTSEFAFLELAFVEVSTNGKEYIRFPAISEIQTNIQIGSFENINARYIHNLAGKYTMYYGTPFDLDELINLTIGTTVDLNQIYYIKIIDVIGTINDKFANYDSQGNKINDPYPTAFSSGGFDLDAVGIINNVQNTKLESVILIKPNPVEEFLLFQTNISNIDRLEIFSFEGKLQKKETENKEINVRDLKPGIYILRVTAKGKSYSNKFIKL